MPGTGRGDGGAGLRPAGAAAGQGSAAVAPVEGDGVEDVAEHAQLGQHLHALDRGIADEVEHGRLQRRAVEVVAIVE